VILGAVLLLCSDSFSEELGEVAFRQALLDLGNDFRLMAVAAHPDDEDGATLAYYRMKHGVETHAVIATRGEGGQNEVGPELYEELGVIRTREMMAAAEVEGAQLHFLNLPEFGYSKTKEETLGVWGEEETLRRVVRVIRELRPQVIITNHGRMNDHGHHQAIGAAVIEAFDIASDPEVFPDQLENGLEPWQPLRLFIRAWEKGPDSYTVDISEFNSLRGKTYAEIAAEALTLHASQGMQFFIDRYLTGEPKVYYDLVKEHDAAMPDDANDVMTLFAGVDPGVPNRLQKLSKSSAPREELKPRLIWLQQRYAKKLRNRTDAPANAAKLFKAAVKAAEIELNVIPRDTIIVPGQELTLDITLVDHGADDLRQLDVEQAKSELSINWESLATDARHHYGTVTFRAEAPAPTLPLKDHLFEADFLRPQLAVVLHSEYESSLFMKASSYVDVAPPIGIIFLDAPYLVQRGQADALVLAARFHNYTPDPLNADFETTFPVGWNLEEVEHALTFDGEDQDTVRRLRVTVPADVGPGEYSVRVRVPDKGEAEARVQVVDMEVPDVHVGVIQSYDDTFVKTLGRMGVSHERITERDFAPERLAEFDVIIVDIRAYQYRPDLVAHNRDVLDFVHDGGTLLVMYQKTFDWQPEYAPYPIQLSRNRVTREDAPVTLLAPKHPLFNMPNAITPEDWAGWIQERGLYFPDQWDAAYTPLVAVTDPGEDIPPGSVLVASYGQGSYLYTALGWYRQLRELHPGALRVFSNMLGL